MIDLAIVILNYRRGELTIGCIETVVPEIRERGGCHAVVVDNGSDDDSADAIETEIASRGWSDVVTLVRSPINGGFSSGNNIGFKTLDARLYLLLNSDARFRPGAVEGLLAAAERHPDAGMIGPRLEDPDGTPQVSCFRYRTPITEFLAAARTGPLDHMFSRCLIPVGVPDDATESPWVSFACVLIRREVIEGVGLMDEDYFMYFEDIDYARRVRRAGWSIVHDPEARVIHLRGGSSSVKSAMSERQRVPRYYYESRSRYYAKFYGGRLGLWMTNGLWVTGRTISGVRELLGSKPPHTCRHEGNDNWTNWLRPMRPPQLPTGGDM